MFNTHLVIDEMMKASNSGKTCYKAIVSGEQLYPLEIGIPLIKPAKEMCLGVAHVFEYQVSAKFTVVFFTLDEASEKACRSFYKLYLSTSSVPTYQKPTRYSDVARAKTSTVDPAMAMSMGRDRAVERVAEDIAGRDGYSVSDMMRLSGMGFDEDI